MNNKLSCGVIINHIILMLGKEVVFWTLEVLTTPLYSGGMRLHEFSMMKQAVLEILDIVRQNSGIKATRIEFEIGELTFLHKKQLQFAFDVIKNEDEVIKDAVLDITIKPLLIKCKDCGYQGGADYEENPYHMSAPLLKCPKCEGNIDIIEGRDFIIKNVEIEVEDE